MSLSFLYFFHIPKTPLTSCYLYFLSPTKTTFIFMIQKFLSASISLSPLGTTLKFLTGVLPSASNTSLQTHLHFWLEYCPLHPTPLYRHTCTSDLSIALYIFITPLYTTYISDLSIALYTYHSLHPYKFLTSIAHYIQPLFTSLTVLTWVLPSTSNPSLQHLHFWLEYCPLYLAF